eukprot:5891870-Amphidinium_carterae.1
MSASTQNLSKNYCGGTGSPEQSTPGLEKTEVTSLRWSYGSYATPIDGRDAGIVVMKVSAQYDLTSKAGFLAVQMGLNGMVELFWIAPA